MHRKKPHNGSEGALHPPTNYVPENDNGNLTSLDHKLGATSVRRYDYTYDRNGMRTRMTDLDGVHDYVYDTLYQIIQATHPTVTNPTELFEYDAAGNRLYDEERAYSYNELNQLVEDDEHWYEHDLDGNMVLKVEKATGDSTKFFWDIENRLVRIEKPGTLAEYSYGPLGRQLAKTVNGTTTEYRYDGEDLILELDGTGAVTGSWTFGPGIDQPLAMNRSGVNHYYLADGLGSVTALADETGAMVQTYEYGVFGEITEQAGNLENPFAYTGREWEREVELYYYRARWYAPQLAGFLSMDPVMSEPGFSQYTYVANCPTVFTDPTGLDRYSRCENKGPLLKWICRKMVDWACSGTKNVACCEQEKAECLAAAACDPECDPDIGKCQAKCMLEFARCTKNTKTE
jgi:RHS repeat-associated protein